MWPFEFVATPTDSPRYSPGGSFRKFGTEVYGISGTFCALAFCWARAGAAHSIRAAAETSARQRVIGFSRDVSLVVGSARNLLDCGRAPQSARARLCGDCPGANPRRGAVTGRVDRPAHISLSRA